jgi:hypothetical protein
MPKPYQLTQIISETMAVESATVWRVELHLVDTPNVTEQRERLIIQTQVFGPLPDHPHGLELAALKRVRDLLSAQIKAMQSL